MARVGSISEERLARNESFFRSVNERIREIVGEQGADGHVYEFICECADTACLERVRLTIAEYEAIRASGTRFLLAEGHDIGAIETVVAETSAGIVVEKVGVAAEIADALDPRAA